MKVSFARARAAAAVVVVGLVVVFLVSRDDGPDPAPAASATPAAAAAPAAAPAGPFKTAVPEPSLTAAGDPARPDDYEDHPLADVMHKVLASDHQLNTFMYYFNRPLLDEADKEKYHQLLADRSVYAGVEHDLLYPEETTADQASNIKRLMKIDFVREALEWKDNPQRGEMISMVKDMLLTDNYPADMAMDMRLSLSGNKMELYEMLNDMAPDQAAAILKASRGTRLEKMFDYFVTHIEAGKQIQASADSQVAPPAH
jgi:hypothetical protein